MRHTVMAKVRHAGTAPRRNCGILECAILDMCQPSIRHSGLAIVACAIVACALLEWQLWNWLLRSTYSYRHRLAHYRRLFFAQVCVSCSHISLLQSNCGQPFEDNVWHSGVNGVHNHDWDVFPLTWPHPSRHSFTKIASLVDISADCEGLLQMFL